MAFSSLIFLTIFFFFHHHAAQDQNFNTTIYPISKDDATLQYYTTITIGTDPISVVIDLGGPILWFDCDHGYNSSSYRPILCGTTKCKKTKSVRCLGCNLPPRPGCTNNTCGGTPYNPFQNLPQVGGLGEDVVSTKLTDGRLYLEPINVPRPFAFSCASSFLLQGLANVTRGIVGLGRSQLSLPTQLASALKFSNKFAICIPSSSETTSSESPDGNIFVGDGPYYYQGYEGDISIALTNTPLITNPVSTGAVYSQGDPSIEYFIGVKSIKVDGKSIHFNNSLLGINKNTGVGGTKLSTVTPYTVLQSDIYKRLIKEFVKAAASRKIKRVTNVAPFGVCFNSKSIVGVGVGRLGPAVPIIDLVLQNKRVYWRIYGANSMVNVNEDVMCLGFIDGGATPRTSIVIGGHQMADNFLKFDLASSKLEFSANLQLLSTSCSRTSRVF